MNNKELEEWCENNLFGKREVEGIRIPLTNAQKAILGVMVEIIQKWEDRPK